MILFLPYFWLDVAKKLLVLTQKFKIYILSECYKKVAVVIKNSHDDFIWSLRVVNRLTAEVS